MCKFCGYFLLHLLTFQFIENVVKYNQTRHIITIKILDFKNVDIYTQFIFSVAHK